MDGILSLLGLSKPLYERTHYPDLNSSDYEITDFFYTMKKNMLTHPKAYEYAKKIMLVRMGQLGLYLITNSRTLSATEKLQLIVRLVNFHVILRENNIPPGALNSLVKLPFSWAEPDPPLNFGRSLEEPIEITPSGLKIVSSRGDETAKRVLSLLSVEKAGGGTYFQYILDNVRSIIFLPHITDHVKILPGNIKVDWLGCEDETSRYLIADTYREGKNSPRDPLFVAGNLVHGAAHLFYYHDPKNANDPARIQKVPYETFAYTTQLEYYDRLLKAVTCQNSNLPFSESELASLRNDMASLKRKIETGNFE